MWMCRRLTFSQEMWCGRGNDVSSTFPMWMFPKLRNSPQSFPQKYNFHSVKLEYLWLLKIDHILDWDNYLKFSVTFVRSICYFFFQIKWVKKSIPSAHCIRHHRTHCRKWVPCECHPLLKCIHTNNHSYSMTLLNWVWKETSNYR